MYVLVSPETSAHNGTLIELHLASGAGCMSGAANRAPNVYRAPAAKCRSVRVPFSRSIGCSRCPSPRP
eukprot:5561607-Pyramimonas_sp.AAC.1